MLKQKSAIIEITDSETTILEAGASEDIIIDCLKLGNVDGSNAAAVALHLTKSGGSKIDIGNTVAIAVGKFEEVFSKDKPLYLESGDKLSATASAADDANALVSYRVGGINR